MSAEEIWSLFTSDQLSPLTSSFWAGRYLQLVEEGEYECEVNALSAQLVQNN